MAPVNIKYVVSFTSQDPKNSVDTLCDVDGGGTRSWLCNARDRSGVLRAELQLERATYIGYIDVGNCGSAFIQIDVGRSSWPLDQPYTTLLPTATLMNPAESRQGTGRTSVRMFKKGDFLLEGTEDSWDRVRVTCTQPFNRHAQFGLSFLRIRSPQEESEGVSTGRSVKESQGQVYTGVNVGTPDTPASGVREWLSSPAVQRTFFGGVKGEGFSEETQRSLLGLSRTTRMVLTSTLAGRCSLPMSPCSTSPGLRIQRPPHTAKADTATPNKGKADAHGGNIHPHTASKACLTTAHNSKENTPQLKRKPNSKSRQNQLNGTPSCKQRKSEVSKRPRSIPLVPTPTDPPQSSSDAQDIGVLETTCPICGVFFTADYLPLHASSCQGVETRKHPGVITPLTSPDPTPSPEKAMFPCPLCSFRFPLSHIQLHASTCGDAMEPQVIWVD